MPPSLDGPSKGNDYAVEALKQVVTLAGAILALTITFLKDTLGDARSDAVLTFLVPVSWGLLVLVIWTGWIALADAARTVGSHQEIQYAFAVGTRTRSLARTAQFAFAAGLSLLGLFAMVNFPLFFHSTRAPKPVSNAQTEHFAERIGHFSSFKSGSSTLDLEGVDLRVEIDRVVSRWLEARRAGRNGLLFLIGSTDRVSLSPQVRARYESNVGLAQARAEALKARLLERTATLQSDLSLREDQVITLVSGPVHTPNVGASGQPQGVPEDRRVDVWALWSASDARTR